ncbi:MAG: hypothetical protein J5585_03980 [Clostridia bacterium]|nr:hypothetical protein [Clostridia bacterium]
MKRFLSVIIMITLLLCSCTAKPEETSTDTVTDTAATEPAVTEPAETVVAHEAAPVDGFKMSRMLKETTTEVNGTANVSVRGGGEYTVEFESRFYGPQSMIDRDSHHMGDLFVAANYAKEYPQDTDYFFGEFTGDRFSEYLIFNDGELRMYKGKGKYAKYNDSKLLYTQKIDVDGVLRGTGDFNGDRFTDLLFMTNKKTAVIGYGSEDGFEFTSLGVLPDCEKYEKESFCPGDVNADGYTDIIAVKGFDTSSWSVKDGAAVLYSEKALNIKDDYDLFAVADINTDGVCDLIVTMPGTGVRTYYGSKDGQFGPHENETDNLNFYPTWESQLPIKYMTPGDTNEDGVSDLVATMKIKVKSEEYLVCSLTYPTEAPAYDYSTSILKKDDGTYILYNGGLYVDYNKDKYKPCDGDHVLVYTSDDGEHWIRNIDAPAFFLGGELGVPNEWWSGNTIEPEVVCVDGVYYMYWQCENYTHLEDGTLIGHDKIGVATSTDGLHFERKTDKPVIINEPEYSSFDHEEVLYYPDDPDGRPYWMYVRHVIRNVSVRYCRIRSADPFEFDYKLVERVDNLQGLGNQIGWLRLDGGEVLFVRIGCAITSASTPALQFSKDGLKWSNFSVILAGVDKTDAPANTGINVYFVGFSTINGTGEIERLEDGRFKFIYGGCTSDSPVAPAIFYSNVGRGECILSIKEIEQ